MSILLDESLPYDLARLILDHQVSTVRHEGWSSVKNEQNLALLPIAVVVLVARKNRVQDLEPLLPQLAEVLIHLAPRTLRTVP